MSIEDKANEVLEEARALASTAKSWTDFSNALFAQDNGVVARAFPRMTERQAFYDLPQYDEINMVLLELIKRFGIAQGAAPQKSGKFVVRVPRTLHSALDIEAQKEGVSLNQLALTKLSVRLEDSTELANSLIVQAFRHVYDGYSSDRIIVDPKYNDRFLRECRKLGLTQSDYELNHALQDIRKSGKAVLPPATKKPQIKDYDGFVFASEIAFRHIQRQEGVSLDQVLCDPETRARFDAIAQQLAPGRSVYKLRMGALYLRKTHRLSPRDSLKESCDLHSMGRVDEVDIAQIPAFPGMYVFYEAIRPIFAGETAQLQRRITLHMKASQHLFLPRWLGIGHEKDLELRLLALPKITHTGRLQWLNQFINRERPPLNYQAPTAA